MRETNAAETGKKEKNSPIKINWKYSSNDLMVNSRQMNQSVYFISWELWKIYVKIYFFWSDSWKFLETTKQEFIVSSSKSQNFI